MFQQFRSDCGVDGPNYGLDQEGSKYFFDFSVLQFLSGSAACQL